jgi:8-oxo-dGTP pyrophosphatase MutT (NUDIX family)
VTVKHATASTFLFTGDADGWRIGLVRHPRFARWMLPGGHVEADENPAQAAVREVREETGRAARLLPAPTGPTPPCLAAAVVPAPHWIVEQQVPADREPFPHVHVDFLYVAVCVDDGPTGDAGARPAADGQRLPFAWYPVGQLNMLPMFAGTRTLAVLLFDRIAVLAEGSRHAADPDPSVLSGERRQRRVRRARDQPASGRRGPWLRRQHRQPPGRWS